MRRKITAFLFDDGHDVGQALVRMVDLALHIEDRNARGFGYQIEVAVADAPIHVADGDTVEIAAEDLAHFSFSIAMRNLGRTALDESRMAA